MRFCGGRVFPSSPSPRRTYQCFSLGVIEDDLPFYMGRAGTSDGHFEFKVNVDGQTRDLTALDGGRVASGGRMDMVRIVIPIHWHCLRCSSQAVLLERPKDLH